MSFDQQRFERDFKREFENYQARKDPQRKPRRKHTPTRNTKGITVELAVRRSQLSPDETFFHSTDTISRLLAFQQAKRAAEAAGWMVGHIREYHLDDPDKMS